MVASHHLGAGNQTQLLCKSSQCSWLLSRPSSPLFYFLNQENFQAWQFGQWNHSHPTLPPCPAAVAAALSCAGVEATQGCHSHPPLFPCLMALRAMSLLRFRV